MDILIKSPREGKQYIVHARPYDTLASVKAKLRDQKQIPVEMLCLLLNGRVLDDRRTLADYRIDAESVVQLVVRPL
jgi:hypothetical protein